jgi:hypothetical protein
LGDVGKDEEEEEERRWEADLGGGKVPFLGMVTLSATLPHQWVSWAVRYDSQISRPVAMKFGDPVLLWTGKKIYNQQKRRTVLRRFELRP